MIWYDFSFFKIASSVISKEQKITLEKTKNKKEKHPLKLESKHEVRHFNIGVCFYRWYLYFVKNINPIKVHSGTRTAQRHQQTSLTTSDSVHSVMSSKRTLRKGLSLQVALALGLQRAKPALCRGFEGASSPSCWSQKVNEKILLFYLCALFTEFVLTSITSWGELSRWPAFVTKQKRDFSFSSVRFAAPM